MLTKIQKNYVWERDREKAWNIIPENYCKNTELLSTEYWIFYTVFLLQAVNNVLLNKMKI
jgi:hypothetical protein